MDKEIFQPKFVNSISVILKILHNSENKFLSKYSLTHFHAQYLINLYINKQMTLTELTEVIGVDKANTTRAIKDMLNKGYIKKLGNGNRKFVIQLTELGNLIAEKFKNYIKQMEAIVFKDFTKKDLDDLNRLTEKFVLGVKNVGNK